MVCSERMSPVSRLTCLIEEYSTLCVVRADLSPLSGSAEPKVGRNGKTYWTIVFSVEIHFGLTEFRARIKWNDNVRAIFVPSISCQVDRFIPTGNYQIVRSLAERGKPLLELTLLFSQRPGVHRVQRKRTPCR